jgi:hypothetical protein
LIALLTNWANRIVRFRNRPAIAAVKSVQASDNTVRSSQLDIAARMYTMAHHLLQFPEDFRLPGVQSVMVNPPFLLRIHTTPLPHLPTERIPDRGSA